MRLATVSVTALSILALSCGAQEQLTPRPNVKGTDPRRPGVQAVQEQPARRDGNWRVIMQMDMPGASQKPQPITFTQCVTKEDAEDPAKLVPLGGPREAPPTEKKTDEKPARVCKVTEQKLDGAKVSWTTLCEGSNPITGVGEFVYSADRYVGTMHVTMKRADQAVTMIMNYSGSRLGDCAKSGRSAPGAPPAAQQPPGRER